MNNIDHVNGTGIIKNDKEDEYEEDEGHYEEEDEDEEEEAVDQFPAYAMAALQRRMSAFALEPPLAIATQPDMSILSNGVTNNTQHHYQHDNNESMARGSMDSGISGTHTDNDHENGATASVPNRRVVIRELVRDTHVTPHGRPFELRVGRGFTAAALEMAVKSMRVGEQSRFLLRRECTEGFAQLERALRLQDSHSTSRRGSLSNAFHHHGASSSSQNSPILPNSALPTSNGASSCLHQLHQHHLRQRSVDPADAAVMNDLETLPLELHIHLLEKRAPTSTGEQWWQWSIARRQQEAMTLRQLGNRLYSEGDWLGATARYEMCLTLLEPMPDDQPFVDELSDEVSVDTKELLHVCLLNLAACALKLRRYALCIQYCDTALTRRPGDAKAHYRRATARIALGEDLSRAREDLEAARSLMLSELRRRGRRMSGVPGITPGFPAPSSLPSSAPTGEANSLPASMNSTGLLGIPFGSTGRTDSGFSCLGAPDAYTENGDGDMSNIYDTDVVGDEDDTNLLAFPSPLSPISTISILPRPDVLVETSPIAVQQLEQGGHDAVAMPDKADPHHSKSIELQRAFQELRRAEQAEEDRIRSFFSPDNVS
ncbi:hypothetical protein BDF19DRAFT_450258 [Syncephalis fuscata]|nr:hypothetical protein BDF19DRAFT_450258 [Syncephalis fuscata]